VYVDADMQVKKDRRKGNVMRSSRKERDIRDRDALQHSLYGHVDFQPAALVSAPATLTGHKGTRT
jgi:hypothetical protein